MPKTRSTSKPPTPTKIKARIKELRRELWALEKSHDGEYAMHGLRLADLRERLWAQYADLYISQDNPTLALAAEKLTIKFGEQRARMSDKTKNDQLDKAIKLIEKRQEEAGTLQAIARRKTVH